jgi:hypothetical protein
MTTARLNKLEVKMSTTLKLLEENRVQLDRVLAAVDGVANKQDQLFEKLHCPVRHKGKMKFKVKAVRAFEPTSGGAKSDEPSVDSHATDNLSEEVKGPSIEPPPLTAPTSPDTSAIPAAASAFGATVAEKAEEEGSGDSDSEASEERTGFRLGSQPSTKWDR